MHSNTAGESEPSAQEQSQMPAASRSRRPAPESVGPGVGLESKMKHIAEQFELNLARPGSTGPNGLRMAHWTDPVFDGPPRKPQPLAGLNTENAGE